MTFNLNIRLPILPFAGKSRKIKYIKAINVDANVLATMPDGEFPFISGKITNMKNGISIITAVIIKSTKKAASLLEFILIPPYYFYCFY